MKSLYKKMAEKTTKKRIDNRVRNWVFILYPNECYDNWSDILNEQHIEWVESPLHDKDINPDGTPKKIHKHIMLLFPTNKSYNQILELLEELGEVVEKDGKRSIKGISIPQECRNVKGQVRYFAHIDNPEKYQYSQKDVIGHNGIDVSSYFVISNLSRYELLGQMTKYIRENEITEFIDFSSYCYEVHFEDWFRLCCDNTMYIREVIQSQWKKKKGKEQEEKKSFPKSSTENLFDGLEEDL